MKRGAAKKDRILDETINRESKGPQEIRVGDQKAVVIPVDVWERILEELEELDDIRAYEEAEVESDQKTIEHDELCRMLGLSPLRYLRQRAGLTQTALAKKSGLSQSYIAKVESSERRPSLKAAKKLAGPLGVTPERLMY
jgi:DNA-binding XRE family transcriptional regulator